jgi:hypothetical protein
VPGTPDRVPLTSLRTFSSRCDAQSKLANTISTQFIDWPDSGVYPKPSLTHPLHGICAAEGPGNTATTLLPSRCSPVCPSHPQASCIYQPLWSCGERGDNPTEADLSLPFRF